MKSARTFGIRPNGARRLVFGKLSVVDKNGTTLENFVGQRRVGKLVFATFPFGAFGPFAWCDFGSGASHLDTVLELVVSSSH